MDKSRWEVIQAAFEQALASPDPNVFAADLATTDPTLAAEVRSLLDADAEAPAYLDDAPTWRLPQVPDHLQTLGPYRLIRTLGQGGMARVYLAHREDLDAHVAIKILPHPFSHPLTRHRFLQERQMLARLRHPNIARVLDAGLTPEHQTPFFVMEYVEGAPLDAYCAAQHPTLIERLRLFRSICEAVAYAHQNLIVHRDLKPSNILVTDARVPKLLDFGIAKLLTPDDVPDPSVTQTGEQVLTPAYAAPEQLRSEPITTATDVYALGLILYELLTDVRAYDVQGRTPGQIETLIGASDPVRPSVRVRTLVPGREADRRARRLRGDLDTIVLKALRRTPTDRYASVDALAEDVERYLNSEPIAARPPSAGYLVRKFMQRHRWPVALVTVGVLLLMLGAVRERNLRSEAEAARDEATAVAGFMQDLFSVASPYSTSGLRGNEATARDLLAYGATRLREDLADQPRLRSALLLRVGDVHGDLALFAEAESLLTEALALQQQLYGPATPEVAEVYEQLSYVYQEQDQYDKALDLSVQALAIRQATGSPEERARVLSRLGLIYWHTGTLDLAERYTKEALALREVHEPQSMALASSVNSLALIYHDQNRLDDAEPLYQRSLELRQQVLDPDHLNVATALHNLADLRFEQQQWAEAERLERAALDIVHKQVGPHHPDILDSNLLLAGILTAQGDLAASESLYVAALDMAYAMHDGPHTNQSATHDLLGEFLQDLGRLDEAEQHMRESLRILLAIHGPEGIDTQRTRLNLAFNLRSQGGAKQEESLVHLRFFVATEGTADVLPTEYAQAQRALNDE
ncbi:MAG: serine/threonine-protein kinase [Bacteroidota bacterium]